MYLKINLYLTLNLAFLSCLSSLHSGQQEHKELWVRTQLNMSNTSINAYINVNSGMTQSGPVGSSNLTFLIPAHHVRLLKEEIPSFTHVPTDQNSVSLYNIFSNLSHQFNAQTRYHTPAITHASSTHKTSHAYQIINPQTQQPIYSDPIHLPNDPAIINDASTHIEPEVQDFLLQFSTHTPSLLDEPLQDNTLSSVHPSIAHAVDTTTQADTTIDYTPNEHSIEEPIPQEIDIEKITKDSGIKTTKQKAKKEKQQDKLQRAQQTLAENKKEKNNVKMIEKML